MQLVLVAPYTERFLVQSTVAEKGVTGSAAVSVAGL